MSDRYEPNSPILYVHLFFLCLFLYIKNFAVDIVFKCVQLLEWCDYSNARLFIFNTYYTRQSPIVPFLMMSIMNKTVCHCFYVICNENSDALLHCLVGEQWQWQCQYQGFYQCMCFNGVYVRKMKTEPRQIIAYWKTGTDAIQWKVCDNRKRKPQMEYKDNDTNKNDSVVWSSALFLPLYISFALSFSFGMLFSVFLSGNFGWWI